MARTQNNLHRIIDWKSGVSSLSGSRKCIHTRTYRPGVGHKSERVLPPGNRTHRSFTTLGISKFNSQIRKLYIQLLCEVSSHGAVLSLELPTPPIVILKWSSHIEDGRWNTNETREWIDGWIQSNTSTCSCQVCRSMSTHPIAWIVHASRIAIYLVGPTHWKSHISCQKLMKKKWILQSCTSPVILAFLKPMVPIENTHRYQCHAARVGYYSGLNKTNGEEARWILLTGLGKFCESSSIWLGSFWYECMWTIL